MTQDYTTINNPRFLFRAEMHQPFPDWVVSQAMPEAGEFTKKAASAFADPKRRLLPICSKSAAFHSAINIFAKPDAHETDEQAVAPKQAPPSRLRQNNAAGASSHNVSARTDLNQSGTSAVSAGPRSRAARSREARLAKNGR